MRASVAFAWGVVTGVSGFSLLGVAALRAADEKPAPFKSGLVSWDKASLQTSDWGEMRVFRRGESFATRDALVCTAVVKPGKAVHRAHRHSEEEYLILTEGSGTWHLDGREFPARQGDILYIEPWVFHGLVNTGTAPLQFTVVRYNGKGVKPPPRPDDQPDEK